MDPITLAVVAVAAYFVFFRGPSGGGSNVLTYDGRGGDKKEITDSRAVAIATDLAELPAALRTYVTSFIASPLATAEDFERGAEALIAGCDLTDAIGPTLMPGFSGESDPSWCFQNAARRLRIIAEERRARGITNATSAKPSLNKLEIPILELSRLEKALALLPDTAPEYFQTTMRKILKMAEATANPALLPYDPAWIREQGSIARDTYGATAVYEATNDLANAMEIALAAKEVQEVVDKYRTTLVMRFPNLFGIPDMNLKNEMTRFNLDTLGLWDQGGGSYRFMIAPGGQMPNVIALEGELTNILKSSLGDGHPAIAELDQLANMLMSFGASRM